MTAEIVVVDYHKGNLSSVERGLVAAGGRAIVSDDPEAISAAQAIVVPGVGSFGDAISHMERSGQAGAIIEAVGQGRPFLGICLGLHLLFDKGDELSADAGQEGEWVAGLGIVHGSCTRLESSRLKVPHVGWDQLDLTSLGKRCPLLEGVPEGGNMYFTHSYAVAGDIDPAFVAARTHYCRSFASVVWKDNVFGVQFHPEKSSGNGLTVLKNFVRIVGEAGR